MSQYPNGGTPPSVTEWNCHTCGTQAKDELPYTGSDLALTGLLGLVLVGAGLALRIKRLRRWAR